jgi:hypothetical protein
MTFVSMNPARHPSLSISPPASTQDMLPTQMGMPMYGSGPGGRVAVEGYAVCMTQLSILIIMACPAH